MSACVNNDPSMVWKLHTPNLLQEVLHNRGTAILRIPLNLLVNLLGQVAQRSSQLNDPVLNKLMCQMALYEIADPESAAYDAAKVAEILKTAQDYESKSKSKP